MKKFIYIGIIALLLACKVKLPEALETKSCITGTISQSVDSADPKKYIFIIKGTPDIKFPITWTTTTGVTLGTSSTNSFSYTFANDGNYTVRASYQTICGDNVNLTSSAFSIATQLVVEKSFSITEPNVQIGLSAITVTNDGTVIANENNSINIWANNIQFLVRTLNGHTGNGNITNLTLSTDDKYLFSTSSSDNDIIVWDWKSGTQTRKITGNQSPFNALNITSDNKYLIGGNYAKQIKIWRVDDGTLTKTITVKDPILSIAMTNDDKYIAARVQNSNGDTSFLLLDAKTGLEVWSMQNGFIYDVEINSIGTEVWLSGLDSNLPFLLVYDISTKKPIKSFNEYFTGNNSPNSIKLSSKNDFLQCGWNLFDSQNKKWIRNNNNHYYFPIDFCAISSENKYIASGSNSGSLALSDLKNGLKLNLPSGKHPMGVFQGIVSQDEKKVISQDFAGIKEWNIITGMPKNIINLNGTYNIALMTDGIWHRSCDLNKISYSSGSPLSYSIVNYCNGNYPQITISKNEKYMAIQTSEMGQISIFNPFTGKNLKALSGHSNNLTHLEFTSDSKYLISSSLDKTIKFWDVLTGTLIKTITFINAPNAVKLNPDDKTITVNESFSTKIFNITDGLQVGTMPISKYLNKIEISSNNKTMAGVSGYTIYLFDNSNGALKKEKTFSTQIKNVSFSASGTQIYVTTQKEFYIIAAP